MVEENNDIFLVGGDALIYLAEIMRKKYSTAFAWSHPFSTYLSYDQFFNPPPSVYSCAHFGWTRPPPFPQLHSYLMDGLFLDQKTNRNIRISYSLKYKHLKKKIMKKNGSAGWNKNSLLIKTPLVQCQLCFVLGLLS